MSMSEWQPIETAPKDGMPLLLFMGNYMAVGGWAPLLKEWTLAGENNEEIVTDGHYATLAPTHWQKLPKKPSEGTWQPIEKLTKEDLPALIRGGTYDWDDSWNSEFIPFTGTSLIYYMPDKWHNAIKGDQCEGHDNYFWHKPEWFLSLAVIGGPQNTLGTLGKTTEQIKAEKP